MKTKANGGLSVQSGNIAQAEYVNQAIASYRDNPWIEALPPIIPRKKAMDLLAYYPPYSPEDRRLSDELRVHYVDTAKQLYQPLTRSLDLESGLSRIIRTGYVGRNFDPTFGWFWKELDRKLEGVRWDHPNLRSEPNVCGTLIIGPSGAGKTTTIGRILRLYPQVIIHSEYQGKPYHMHQVVYLRLECPGDGSLKGLILNFFHAMDDLLGTDYYRTYASNGRTTMESMRPSMARVAAMHGLGVLIIDEAQNLCEASSGGDKRMLNYFVSLENTFSVPVVLIGTNKVSHILVQDEFRQARRLSGEGFFWFDRMGNDLEWKVFVKALWRYQYTRNRCEITDTLADTMYEVSQGIPDVAVKLFRLSQIMAINSGKEILTEGIIRATARDNFQLLTPALRALRENDRQALQRYEDLYPAWDIQSRTINRSTNSVPSDTSTSNENPAGGMVATERPPTPKKILRSTVIKDSPPDSSAAIETLSQIVEKGIANNQSAYDALKAAGLIGL